MTREEFDQLIAGLVRDGVLKKRGTQYELLDFGRLPEQVRRQGQEVKQITGGTARAMLITLSRPRAASHRH
jgi:hypothetical protein